MTGGDITRRAVLKGAAAIGAGALLSSCVPPVHPRPRPPWLRRPGSRPFPRLPEGTDTLPQIEHIVVVMQENQSYDQHFGFLRRGDGFRIGRDGLPLHANADASGQLVRSFHM